MSNIMAASEARMNLFRFFAGAISFAVHEKWFVGNHGAMKKAKTFRRGERVSWNSEVGRVTGVIQKKITSPMTFKGYVRHASKDEPQYVIKSEKTDHVAIHKGSALRKLGEKKGAKVKPRRRPRGVLR